MYHAVVSPWGFYSDNNAYVEYSRSLGFYSFDSKKERDFFVDQTNESSNLLYRFKSTRVSGRVYAHLKAKEAKILADLEYCKYRKWLKDNLA